MISSKLIKVWFTIKEPLHSTHEKSPTHKIDSLFFLQQSIDKSELCLQKNWVTLTATSLFVILLYLTWWQSNFSLLTLKRKLHKNLKYHSKKYQTKTWKYLFLQCIFCIAINKSLLYFGVASFLSEAYILFAIIE